MAEIFGVDIAQAVADALSGAGGLRPGVLEKIALAARSASDPTAARTRTPVQYAFQGFVEHRAVLEPNTAVAKAVPLMTIIGASVRPGPGTAATGTMDAYIGAYGVTAKTPGTAGNNIRIVVEDRQTGDHSAQYMRLNGSDLKIVIFQNDDIHWPTISDPQITNAAGMAAALNADSRNTVVTFDTGDVGQGYGLRGGTYTLSGGVDPVTTQVQPEVGDKAEMDGLAWTLERLISSDPAQAVYQFEVR